ncbi:MAG: AMP nucleosidase [Parachlamydiales bacterium]|nr:AMP nucleosidase [Parachlamydiales bacterium]
MIIEEGTPQKEGKIARDSLERYSGCELAHFCPNLLITNFPQYVKYFAESRNVTLYEGSMFRVAHSPKEGVSILDFKVGSPVAALVVDLCAALPFTSALLLGMCGGLRRHYKVGDYLVPVASIRGEGTSDYYFPAEVPALANFLLAKTITEVLDEEELEYYVGITHTTNIRFWEFNEEFKHHLKSTRAQAIEMECATLFAASYKHKFPLASLLLVSDLPLATGGIKTKQSSKMVFEKYMANHVDMGVRILQRMEQNQKNYEKIKERLKSNSPEKKSK